MMIGEDGEVCKFCKVTVSCEDGTATARYRWETNSTDGSDRFVDDDMRDWSEEDVRDHAAHMIGIEDGADEIEVVWE